MQVGVKSPEGVRLGCSEASRQGHQNEFPVGLEYHASSLKRLLQSFPSDWATTPRFRWSSKRRQAEFIRALETLIERVSTNGWIKVKDEVFDGVLDWVEELRTTPDH